MTGPTKGERMPSCQLTGCDQEGVGFIEITYVAGDPPTEHESSVRVCQEHLDAISEGSVTGFSISNASLDDQGPEH
jgi:hypothetical protein